MTYALFLLFCLVALLNPGLLVITGYASMLFIALFLLIKLIELTGSTYMSWVKKDRGPVKTKGIDGLVVELYADDYKTDHYRACLYVQDPEVRNAVRASLVTEPEHWEEQLPNVTHIRVM